LKGSAAGDGKRDKSVGKKKPKNKGDAFTGVEDMSDDEFAEESMDDLRKPKKKKKK
jgi:hypothetical protein